MHEPSDFRSDTVTKPTPRMKQAAVEADLGDDVLGDDPTSRKLEEMAADMTGKEAALFVSSGTQGNVVAVTTHCGPGDEVILDQNSHIFVHEQGALSRIAFAQPRVLPQERGMMDLDAVRSAIREPDLHHPVTRLICAENTHNLAGGVVLPMEYLKGLREIADENGLMIHMDGARLFNASVASGIPAGEFASRADSVMFCLSKGLCCPVGSMLCGTQEFIDRARRVRKLLGGGMRQLGFLAAPGIVALSEMVERLAEDHRRARLLAEGIAETPGLVIDLDEVQSNLVYFRPERAPAGEVVGRLRSEGVLCFDQGARIRMVTHKDIDDDDIERAVTALKKVS